MTSEPLELAFAEYGEGPPLVITHGLFGMGRNWTPIAKTLAEGFHVFLVDLRNHGDSPWADGMEYPEIAADLAHFIDQHTPSPATLIGHSMGGKAAMTVALEHPGMVSRLVVADIAPTPYDHDFSANLDAMKSLDLASFKRRREAQAALAEALGDKALASFLIHNLRHSDAQGFRWRLNLEAISGHVDDLLDFPIYEADSAYEGPTLFMAGDQSPYIRPYHHVEIERLFPKATIEFIENAGHWIHAEQPASVTKKILTFLNQK